MSSESFSGFLPVVKDINITDMTSFLTTNGDLMNGHIVKIISGDGNESYYSISHDQLRSIFFLAMKILMV